jgi:hypothetical protein
MRERAILMELRCSNWAAGKFSRWQESPEASCVTGLPPRVKTPIVAPFFLSEGFDRMQSNPSQNDLTSVRWLRLALVAVFCVAMAMAIAQANYQLVTPFEVHAFLAGADHPSLLWIFRECGVRFGGSAPVMRLPFLALFGLAAGAALWALERFILRRYSAVVVAAIAAGLAAAIVAGEAVSLRHVRAERNAFFHLRNEVESSAAPGEPVVLESPGLGAMLSWYGSAELRQQLFIVCSQPLQCTGLQPYSAARRGGELVYVGFPRSEFAAELLRAGYALRPMNDESPEVVNALATYATPGAGIYFATPLQQPGNADAVSSKP